MKSEVIVSTAQTQKFSMNYLKFGHGERVLVILLGLSVEKLTKYADVIADSYAMLTDDFTIYMFDKRNELPDTYSVQEMAEDTAEVIRGLGLEKISLFGMSQGGMMSMTIAAENPELVDKLVLASTSAHVTDEQFRTIDEWIELARKKDAKVLYHAFGEKIYSAETFETVKEYLADCSQNVTEEELERFLILAGGMKHFDIRDILPQIACPVMLTGSKDDRVLGVKATEEIAEILKDHHGLELNMYNGYGHAVYDVLPGYKDMVRGFLLGASYRAG